MIDLSQCRILVVEDEFLVAEEIAQALEDRGAQVIGPFPTVSRALRYLEAGSPVDAAVLDINLQGEMVYPVADALRERGVPFVFATGYALWAIPERYRHLPRCEKPVDAASVIKALFTGAG